EVVPPGSVAAVHVYFPDPWPKTRHRHRRLFDRPGTAEAIARVLVPGGSVHVASDLPWLHRLMRERLGSAGLLEVAPCLPARPVSKFERKYAAAGTHTATFVKRAYRGRVATRRGRGAPTGRARRARRRPRSRSAP